MAINSAVARYNQQVWLVSLHIVQRGETFWLPSHWKQYSNYKHIQKTKKKTLSSTRSEPKTELVPKIIARGNKRTPSKSHSNSSLGCFVRQDVVRKDQLWRDFPNHSEHGIILLIPASILFAQNLLKLDHVQRLRILGSMHLG